MTEEEKPYALKFRAYPKTQSLFKRGAGAKFIDEYSLPEFGLGSVWNLYDKIDGTNIRIGYQAALGDHDPSVVIGGRTDNAQLPVPLMTYLLNTFPLSKMQAIFGEQNVVLYGEGVGPKIQDGFRAGYMEEGFVLFDAVIRGIWQSSEVLDALAEQLGVPRPSFFKKFIAEYKGNNNGLRDLMLSLGKEPQFKHKEGFIARPALHTGKDVVLFTATGDRLIWKVKFKDQWWED